MKHWDESDRDQAAEVRLSPRDRQRLRDLLTAPPQPNRGSNVGTLIGVTLSAALLIGLALLLGPNDPVSSKILD